jgi:flagellar motor switch protein FliG
MESNSKNGGIFINGKKQVVELLQHMNESERKKLLNNIKNRNAIMAKELSEQSLCFRDLFQLDDHIIRRILQNINNSTIIGLALFLSPTNIQRKALSLMDRSDAEDAFHVMNSNLAHKRVECQKAQEKILNLAIQLSRKSLITL